jgi:hypothetical protein
MISKTLLTFGYDSTLRNAGDAHSQDTKQAAQYNTLALLPQTQPSMQYDVERLGMVDGISTTHAVTGG